MRRDYPKRDKRNLSKLPPCYCLVTVTNENAHCLVLSKKISNLCGVRSSNDIRQGN